MGRELECHAKRGRARSAAFRTRPCRLPGRAAPRALKTAPDAP